MKSRILLICCMAWCCPHALPAQSGHADLSRVDSLNDLAFGARGEPARQYALAAQELARAIGYKKGEADSYLRLGRVAAQAGNYTEGERQYRLALAIREKLGHRPDVASCYNQLGNLRKKQGDYTGAAECFRQGLDLMEKQPPHLNTITLNYNLGHAYRLLGQYDRAKQHLETACRMHNPLRADLPAGATAAELEMSQASARLNLAEFLQSALHLYGPAADSLQKSLKTFSDLDNKANVGKCLLLLGNNAYEQGDLEAALIRYEQGIALGEHLLDEDRYLLYRNRGRVALDERRYDQAIADFRFSLAAFEARRDSQHLAAVLSEIGNYHYELDQSDSAVYYYKMALAHDIQDPMLKSRLLYFLSDALYSAGQVAPSQQYTEEYIHLLNGLNAEQTSGTFVQLNRYFLDKNRLQRQLTRQGKQTQQTYGLILIGVLALLALLGWLFARLQHQKRRLAERQVEIARQQEQMAVQEKLDILKARETEIGYARLEAQNERQRQIGQELHDNLGGTLTTVRLYLGDVEEAQDALPPPVREQYHKAAHLLARACEDLRRISHDLHTATQMTFGLERQLKAWAADIPLQVELTTHGLEERLDLKTEINIFRLVQELVHNVVKHAKAQNVTIAVSRFSQRVNVLVEDDGQGFDVAAARLKPGLGLQNTDRRVLEMNGVLQIDSQPGHGTTVSIDLPISS